MKLRWVVLDIRGNEPLGIRQLSLLVVASVLLSGCVAYPDGWTPEMIAAYEQQQAVRSAQSSAFLAQQTQALQAQAAQTPVPQVESYGQPNSSAVVYCRDLTGSIVACRQIR